MKREIGERWSVYGTGNGGYYGVILEQEENGVLITHTFSNLESEDCIIDTIVKNGIDVLNIECIGNMDGYHFST